MDVFQKQAKRLIDEGAITRIEDCLLLAAGGFVAAITQWLEESYKSEGEEVPHGVVSVNLGEAHYWLLDRRLTAREIIAALAARRIVAEERKIGRLDAVYISPVQQIARYRKSLWN